MAKKKKTTAATRAMPPRLRPLPPRNTVTLSLEGLDKEFTQNFVKSQAHLFYWNLFKSAFRVRHGNHLLYTTPMNETLLSPGSLVLVTPMDSFETQSKEWDTFYMDSSHTFELPFDGNHHSISPGGTEAVVINLPAARRRFHEMAQYNGSMHGVDLARLASDIGFFVIVNMETKGRAMMNRVCSSFLGCLWDPLENDWVHLAITNWKSASRQALRSCDSLTWKPHDCGIRRLKYLHDVHDLFYYQHVDGYNAGMFSHAPPESSPRQETWKPVDFGIGDGDIRKGLSGGGLGGPPSAPDVFLVWMGSEHSKESCDKLVEHLELLGLRVLDSKREPKRWHLRELGDSEAHEKHAFDSESDDDSAAQHDDSADQEKQAFDSESDDDSMMVENHKEGSTMGFSDLKMKRKSVSEIPLDKHQEPHKESSNANDSKILLDKHKETHKESSNGCSNGCQQSSDNLVTILNTMGIQELDSRNKPVNSGTKTDYHTNRMEAHKGSSNVGIYAADLESLGDGQFVSDGIIKFAFQKLMSKLHDSAINNVHLIDPAISFFICTAKEKDLTTTLDFLQFSDRGLHLFAVNNNVNLDSADGGTHWSLLVFDKLSLNSQRFTHFDSAGGSNLQFAHRLAQRIAPDVEITEGQTPQQSNSTDCGCYVISFATSICNWFLRKKAGSSVAIDDWSTSIMRDVNAEGVRKLRKRLRGILEKIVQLEKEGMDK
ncbi:hypothetical protein ACP4OV_023075 [Aristida adscensionis]